MFYETNDKVADNPFAPSYNSQRPDPDAAAVIAAIPLSEFYGREFPDLEMHDEWAHARCCFHLNDESKCLRINFSTGSFYCTGRSCDGCGHDVVVFTIFRRSMTWPEATRALAREWHVSLPSDIYAAQQASRQRVDDGVERHAVDDLHPACGTDEQGGGQ